jgi:hypothetical protein
MFCQAVKVFRLMTTAISSLSQRDLPIRLQRMCLICFLGTFNQLKHLIINQHLLYPGRCSLGYNIDLRGRSCLSPPRSNVTLPSVIRPSHPQDLKPMNGR